MIEQWTFSCASVAHSKNAQGMVVRSDVLAPLFRWNAWTSRI
jgi:hypothetical protein